MLIPLARTYQTNQPITNLPAQFTCLMFQMFQMFHIFRVFHVLCFVLVSCTQNVLLTLYHQRAETGARGARVPLGWAAPMVPFTVAVTVLYTVAKLVEVREEQPVPAMVELLPTG